MKKRHIQKLMKKWSDNYLFDFLRYNEDKRWLRYARKEYDKRNR